MRIIGLCGGSGAGKGYCSKIFSSYNIPSIDTDKVYHEIVSGKSACLDELVSYFGSEIIAPDGSLDRRRLSSIVFGDKKNGLSTLNQITHKHILASTRERIRTFREAGYPAVLIDAPLLFESGFDEECDVTLGIIADDDVRISRIVERDGIDAATAQKRISSQLSNEEIREKCDYVIVNNGDSDALMTDIRKIAEKILEIGD